MASRHVAVIGTSTWSGGGVKSLNKLVEELGWNQIGSSIEAKYSAGKSDYELCDILAKELAETILS
jgi:flavorubredoxin